MEPASLVMERKMLLGIKQRAERLARQRPGSSTAAVAHGCNGAIASTALHRDRPSTWPGGDFHVLVAYASKYGSTKGVAERIAATLLAAGCRVELLAVDQVPDASVYDAVIFGSAVFNQRWLPEAEQFIDRNRRALANRPVWLFSVGTFGDQKRIIGTLMKREPKGIRTLAEAICPREYRVFAGIIDRHQWPFMSRLFYYSLGGHLGDNRDWRAIEEWAEDIGRALRSTKTKPAADRPADHAHSRDALQQEQA